MSGRDWRKDDWTELTGPEVVLVGRSFGRNPNGFLLLEVTPIHVLSIEKGC